jgi:hypothetical protein
VNAYAQRVGDDCERWIDRRRRREVAAVDDVKVVDLVGAAVDIERRGLLFDYRPILEAEPPTWPWGGGKPIDARRVVGCDDIGQIARRSDREARV